jgi:hypothetical protein
MLLITAKARAGGGPQTSQARKVTAATPSTIGTKMAATESASR